MGTMADRLATTGGIVPVAWQQPKYTTALPCGLRRGLLLKAFCEILFAPVVTGIGLVVVHFVVHENQACGSECMPVSW